VYKLVGLVTGSRGSSGSIERRSNNLLLSGILKLLFIDPLSNYVQRSLYGNNLSDWANDPSWFLAFLAGTKNQAKKHEGRAPATFPTRMYAQSAWQSKFYLTAATNKQSGNIFTKSYVCESEILFKNAVG